jgi:hypothetical protein
MLERKAISEWINCVRFYSTKPLQPEQQEVRRDMMYTVEQLQVVAKEQYGSRKCAAITALTLDLCTSIETPSRNVL